MFPKLSKLISPLLLLVATGAQAVTWNVSVVKLNSYTGTTTQKFVWVTDGIGSACTGGALTFDSSGEAGKTLYALLLTALVSGKRVELNIDSGGYGCNLLEAYILR